MKFTVIDGTTLKPRRYKHNEFYVAQDGRLWADCDPTGVDMSGKRRIVMAPNKFAASTTDKPDSAVCSKCIGGCDNPDHCHGCENGNKFQYYK